MSKKRISLVASKREDTDLPLPPYPSGLSVILPTVSKHYFFTESSGKAMKKTRQLIQNLSTMSSDFILLY